MSSALKAFPEAWAQRAIRDAHYLERQELKNRVNRMLAGYLKPLNERLELPNESRAFDDRLESRKIMQMVEHLFAQDRLSDLDLVLYAANIDKMSSRAIVGLIRSTARARTLLPSWNGAYLKAWDAIQDLGKDPAPLFVGLPLPGDACFVLDSVVESTASGPERAFVERRERRQDREGIYVKEDGSRCYMTAETEHWAIDRRIADRRQA